MYGFSSCSTIIHLIAQRPRTILAIGLLATAGNYIYATQKPVARYQIERAVSAAEDDAAERAFARVQDVRLSDSAIRLTEKQSCSCDLAPAEVRANRFLRRDVGKLYFLDLVQEYGINEATRVYQSQK